MPSLAEIAAGYSPAQEPSLDDLANAYASAPTPSPAAQGKFGRIADAIAGGLRQWIETPGRAMREGITTGQAADWAAPTAIGMIGAPGVPHGALGTSRGGMRWSGLENAEAGLQRALELRNAGGGGTMRVFNTEKALDASRRPLSETELASEKAKYGWRGDSNRALDDFRAAVAGDLPKNPNTGPDPFGPRPEWPISAGEPINVPPRGMTAKDSMTLMDILAKYGLAGAVAGGAANEMRQ